jgi:hypothetical protein
MLIFAWHFNYTKFSFKCIKVLKFGINMILAKASPEHVLNDITIFISHTYSENLPNLLLIAQAFILKYPDHGREFGLSEINRVIEDGMKSGIF